MFSVLLNACLTVMFFLFAFSAGRADIYVVAVAAAMIGLWTFSSMIQAIRRTRKGTGHDTVDE